MGMVGRSSARGRARVLPGLTNLLDGRSGRNGVSSKEEIELSGRDLSKGLDPPDNYARANDANRREFNARITRYTENAGARTTLSGMPINCWVLGGHF
jgi:hypothetical protein